MLDILNHATNNDVILCKLGVLQSFELYVCFLHLSYSQLFEIINFTRFHENKNHLHIVEVDWSSYVFLANLFAWLIHSSRSIG